MKSRASKPRQSAKEIVRAKYPKAYAYKWSGLLPWVIYAAKEGAFQGMSLNVQNSSAREAWRAAARHYTVTGGRP